MKYRLKRKKVGDFKNLSENLEKNWVGKGQIKKKYLDIQIFHNR